MEFDLGGNGSVSLEWCSVWNNGGVEGAPCPRVGGVLHCVGRHLLVIGGRDDNNGSLKEAPLSRVYTCHVESHEWSSEELEAPAGNRSEIYMYSSYVEERGALLVACGGEMLALEGTAWSTLGSLPGNFGSPTTMGRLGDRLFVQTYNELFAFDLESAQWAREDVEKRSEVPYETHHQNLFAVGPRMLLLLPNYYSGAPVYLYHTVERKWAQIPFPSDKLSGLSGGRAHLVEHMLVWINARDWNTHVIEAWVLDLLQPSKGWVHQPIKGDNVPYHRGCMQQTERQPDGSIFFAGGLGEKEEDYQMARLALTYTGNAPPDWKDALERVVLEHIAPMETPPPPVHAFSSEEIVVDASLRVQEVVLHPKMASDLTSLLANGEPFEPDSIVHSSLPESEAHVKHTNMMHYLTLCWNAHLGVVISPDMLLYTVLCELADEVSKSPDTFRHLFTHTSDKPMLVVPTSDPAHLDLEALVAQVEAVSPTDPELFRATFSTTDAASKLACSAAFLEMMGSYYTYGNTCCGLSKISVQGTEADWKQLEAKVLALAELFRGSSASLGEYLDKAASGVRDVYTRRDADHWRSFFSISNCHSGHTDVVEGWAVKFFRKGYANERRGVLSWAGTDFYNYESHISAVPWRNVETGASFRLLTGLVYSIISEDGYLTPHFGHVVQRIGVVSPEAYARYLAGLSDHDRDFVEWATPYLEPDEQLVIQGNVKTEVVLRAWRQRLADERANTTLRPLVVRYSNWFSPFMHTTPDAESMRAFTSVFCELLDLNCWSEIDLNQLEDLAVDQEQVTAHLLSCTAMTSLRVGHNADDTTARIIRGAPDLVSLQIPGMRSWHPEFADAVAARQWERLEVNVALDSEENLLALLREKPPRTLVFSTRVEQAPMVWAFLAGNPDCTELVMGRGMNLESPLVRRIVRASTRMRYLSCYSLPANLLDQPRPNITSLTVDDNATPDLSVLAMLPNLDTLRVSCCPGVLLKGLEVFPGDKLRSVSLQKYKVSSHNHAQAPQVLRKLVSLGVEQLSIHDQYIWKQEALDTMTALLLEPQCPIKSLDLRGWKRVVSLKEFWSAVAANTHLESLSVGHMGTHLTLEQLKAILQGAPALRSLRVVQGYKETALDTPTPKLDAQRFSSLIIATDFVSMESFSDAT